MRHNEIVRASAPEETVSPIADSCLLPNVSSQASGSGGERERSDEVESAEVREERPDEG